MGAWNVDLISNFVQSTVSTNSKNTFAVNNSAGFSSDYAKILSQQIAQLKNDVQNESENQDQISANTDMEVIETVKRFRPDGSIMITTYKDGKIDSTTKIKPHLVPMPDYSAPPTPEGQPETKLIPHLSVAELLML